MNLPASYCMESSEPLPNRTCALSGMSPEGRQLTTRSSPLLSVTLPGSTSIFVRVIGGMGAARAVELAFLDQQDELVETLVVDVDPEGRFMAHPSAPPGEYKVVIDIVGARKLSQKITLPPDGEVHLDPEEVCLGDVNGDGEIDFGDINAFVSCLTAP